MASQQTVAIIGGGLVGAISACFFAKRGFVVDLYEYREDIRLTKHVRGRTINLTLAARGQMALRQLGLEEAVVRRHGVALRGRMVHADGTRRAILYDPVSQQCTYSVSRRFLNELLLTATEKYSNVKLHFKHKLVAVNFDENKMTFLVEGVFMERTASLVVGADGAFSTVRRHMLKQPLFDFSQKYIEHGYLELCIPPTPEGEFAMEPDYLHLWPRGTFMMIALPNQDCSWTVTLFMPLTQFATLASTDAVIPFFEENFPDAVQLIGRERLVRDFLSAQPSTLITIKCNPYNVGNSAVIIGDAAHAMVPFYGQGMNAGFEDCLLLNDLLDQYNNDLTKVLPLFSKIRNKDAEAICDLAMYNYFEMRDLVNRRWFLLRKKLDYILYCLMPNLWIPLYHSVTFTSKGYRWCYDNKIWQDKVLKVVLHLCVLLITIGIVLIVWFLLPSIGTSNCIPASGFDL